MKKPSVTLSCLPLAALLVVSLAACGGGGSKANASTSSNTSNGNANTSAFTKCLSDHGVTLPARGFPGGGENGGPPTNGSIPDFGSGNGSGTPPQGSFPGGPGGSGGSNSQFQTAFNACRSKLPSGGNRPGFGANSQALQAYTSCLRSHGVNVPTTTAGSAGTGAFSNLRNDPKFASANQTCRALLPTNGTTTTTVGG